MYTSVVGGNTVEKTIEKSRFITYCAHVESEEEARAFLARVRGEHPLATHVCYAFIADKTGNLQRFSDDGEPQGTAGMPILGVIKAKKLFETSVAVVRYFGGIKLGAGGLTRAYAGCAADGLEAAEFRIYDMCVELTLGVDYSLVKSALRFLEEREVLSRDFGAAAQFTVAVREEEKEKFIIRAVDCFHGKVSITEGKRYFYPFKK